MTGAQEAAPLECTLSVAPRVKQGEPMTLRFRLTNRGRETLYVLDWHTPLEGLRSRMLEVKRNGAELPYQGPLVKRAAPTADDYRELAPGASVDGEVDVGLAYDTAAPGRYALGFPGPLMDVAHARSEVPRETPQPMAVRCAPVETERL
ncbi:MULTISPECIES: protease [Myxococcaceae]|uniref:protease n=1 Tax=Myxococcaceae TaxID=31 RepID=UPI001E394441|nr:MULTISPECIES: protease [Myxococcaceae]